VVEIGELCRKADELRSRIGHKSPRELFDLCQLVEELALYLKRLAESQQEID